MIYLIDDRIRRQEEYGWTAERFQQYADYLHLIKNEEELVRNMSTILSEGNTVLFHESFMLSTDIDVTSEIDSFKRALLEMGNKLYVTMFSGSKQNRFVHSDGYIAMLPADVVYKNLDVFLNNKGGVPDFRYLTYGDNFQIEEKLRNCIISINNEDSDKEPIEVDEHLFFASVSDGELTVNSPFSNAIQESDWDSQFIDTNINDTKLNELVHQWFDKVKYDIIYFPLCFGEVLSDFIGLRLAMHIRLTDSPNREVPIFIYGECDLQDLLTNECFDILKTNGCTLISGRYDSLVQSLNIQSPIINWKTELSKIHVNIPSNIGDNHSVSNRWAISRWTSMFDWKGNVPNVLEDSLRFSLYFKYLESKLGTNQRFRQKDLIPSSCIRGIEDKKIVYIDDEYDKGWDSLLNRIVSDSKANYQCFKSFSSTITKDELIDRIRNFVDSHDADCFIIDLRLHQSDFIEGNVLTGHIIAEYIKSKNKGNQIIIFSASNKVWNLKKAVHDICALDYILKEAPEMKLNRNSSKALYDEFYRSVQLGCNMSYLKDMVIQQKELKELFHLCKELDSIIDLLQKDSNKGNQDLMAAALLSEMVFIEDFFKNQLNLSISIMSKDTLMEQTFLHRNHNNKNKQIPLTKRIYIRKERINGWPNVVEISPYFSKETQAPEGFEVINDTKELAVVSCGILAFLELPVSVANGYIKFKAKRNQLAHQIKGVSITPNDIKTVYFDVIVPIVKAGKIHINGLH